MLPASLAVSDTPNRGKPLTRVGEFVRFIDPVTETPVVRLTSPSSTNVLPAPANRFVSLKSRFLLFSSDRAGRMAPFKIELRTGMPHQVAETSALVPESLYLERSERLLFFVDDGVLKEVSLANTKVRPIAEDVSAFTPLGAAQFIIVRRGRLELLEGGRAPLAESVAHFCLVRPGGNGCLFSRQTTAEEREFWYAPLSGATGNKPVRLASGNISDPFWSSDGQSLLFLRQVQNGESPVSEIHEVIPETGAEQCLAPTSQFAAFAPNADASVFVGASRSKAQPTVILMLRSVRRELTLCEHRASHPGSVSPVFSPDSRRVYFQSDHEGKPALYSVNVELLVEPTVPLA